jgi:hypothetical protein
MNTKTFTHFIPNKYDEQPPWAENLKVKIVTYATTLGLAPGESTDVGDACQNIIDANNKVAAKRLELDEAINNRKVIKNTYVKFLRQLFKRIKAHPLYTPAIGGELGIIGSSYLKDLNAIQPTLRLVGQADAVKVFFNLQGMHGVNIYSRIKGSSNWVFLTNHYNSPYLDRRPLSQPGKAENREYMAVYHDGNQPIGIQSSIETIAFGGLLNDSSL